MATYAPVNVTRAGVEASLVAVSAEDDFPNDGRAILVVANGSGSPVNLDFPLAVDPNANEPTQATSTVDIAIPAGETRYVGPFPLGKFGSTVTVQFSATATITAGVLRLPAS